MSTNPKTIQPVEERKPSPVLALSFLLFTSFAILLLHFSIDHPFIGLAFIVNIIAVPAGILSFIDNLESASQAKRAFLVGMITGHVALLWIMAFARQPHQWSTVTLTAEAILAGFAIGGLALGDGEAVTPSKPLKIQAPAQQEDMSSTATKKS